MTRRTRRFALVGAVTAVLLAVAGCSGQSTSSTASSTPSASTSADAASQTPEVDRSGKGNFPEVTGSFGEKPTIAAGKGDEPTTIIAKTLHQGNGAEIGLDDTVTVHYAGALWSNGTIFDSSFERGTPATFSLNQVIPGWKYGLAHQHVGDRVELVIPARWAYGEKGSGDKIPANSTLTFVVDILGSLNANDTSALAGAHLTGAALPAGITVNGDLGTEPTIAFGADMPMETTQTVIAEGTGAEIQSGDTVMYHGVAGLFGQEGSQSTWKSGAQTIPADQAKLVGTKVGSRVLFVYYQAAVEGKDGKAGTPARASAIVVDILGAMHAAQ